MKATKRAKVGGCADQAAPQLYRMGHVWRSGRGGLPDGADDHRQEYGHQGRSCDETDPVHSRRQEQRCPEEDEQRDRRTQQSSHEE